jgi:hypothetical protein
MSNDTEKDYWDTVQTLAEECHREGYAPWEQVTDSQWISDPITAHKVWLYSPHKDAVFDHGEGLAGCNSTSEALTRVAFHAMLADVQARAAKRAEG